mmetsp:Transcript_23516/g.59384  ORF Transcript_23516/g.59384 Transcript_23516/m.59384 type:complete len:234 (+) Transcript_23516:378-1079(+)
MSATCAAKSELLGGLNIFQGDIWHIGGTNNDCPNGAVICRRDFHGGAVLGDCADHRPLDDSIRRQCEELGLFYSAISIATEACDVDKNSVVGPGNERAIIQLDCLWFTGDGDTISTATLGTLSTLELHDSLWKQPGQTWGSWPAHYGDPSLAFWLQSSELNNNLRRRWPLVRKDCNLCSDGGRGCQATIMIISRHTLSRPSSFLLVPKLAMCTIGHCNIGKDPELLLRQNLQP